MSTTHASFTRNILENIWIIDPGIMFLNINELGYNVPSIGPRIFHRIGPSIDPSMDSNTLNVIPVRRYDDALQVGLK